MYINNWRVETLQVHYRDRDFLVAADVIIIVYSYFHKTLECKQTQIGI